MRTEDIDWDKETILYVLVVNCFVKFGITSNLDRRFKGYSLELEGLKYTVIKKTVFQTRWQAELIEQVMKWRLKRWVVNGRHEWVEIPIQVVLDCMNQTLAELSEEYPLHQHIHKNGKRRWDFYRQIAEYYFSDN
jgi:hypothetical protein